MLVDIAVVLCDFLRGNVIFGSGWEEDIHLFSRCPMPMIAGHDRPVVDIFGTNILTSPVFFLSKMVLFESSLWFMMYDLLMLLQSAQLGSTFHRSSHTAGHFLRRSLLHTQLRRAMLLGHGNRCWVATSPAYTIDELVEQGTGHKNWDGKAMINCSFGRHQSVLHCSTWSTIACVACHKYAKEKSPQSWSVTSCDCALVCRQIRSCLDHRIICHQVF